MCLITDPYSVSLLLLVSDCATCILARTLSLFAQLKYAPLHTLSTDYATCTTAAVIVHVAFFISAYCTIRVP